MHLFKQEDFMKIQVCRVKNLFGSNDYREGKMASHVITVGKINYIPLDFVKRTGFLYDLEDIEEIEYTPAFKSELEPIKNIKRSTLAVSYIDLFGNNNIIACCEDQVIVKDNIKYLTLDTIDLTGFDYLDSWIQAIEI